MRLYALTDAERISQIRFQVRGCTAAIAAGSALAEWLHGTPLRELAQWKPDSVETALGGVPDASRHVLALCGDAMKLLRTALKV